MQIHVGNLRRAGNATLIDVYPQSVSLEHRTITVTLRMVGASVRPSVASSVPHELIADIFAGVREFIGKNEEQIGGLLRRND